MHGPRHAGRCWCAVGRRERGSAQRTRNRAGALRAGASGEPGARGKVVVRCGPARHTARVARRKHRGAEAALAAAALVHAVLFVVWTGHDSTRTSAGPGEWDSESTPPPAQVSQQLATVSLVAWPASLPSVQGASESWSSEAGTASPSAAVAPGQAFGRRAPGLPGATSVSERSDDAARSTGLWNHPTDTQSQHASIAAPGTTSPEALERSPDVDYSHRRVARRKALLGDDADRVGLAHAGGEGGASGTDGVEWFAADPRFDTAPEQSSKKQAGVPNPNQQAPRQDQGALSAENSERGAVTQWANAAELSSRERSSAFDLGAPSTGATTGLGAGGTTGKSVASQGQSGRAAKNGSEVTSGQALTHATRSNPYFYAMYKSIDRNLRFPHDLALALEQGEVVLQFHLDPQGRVQDLRVERSSDFKQFDKEALRAFRAAGPFGPVPKGLLAGRNRLSVIAPYYFRNPLIR